MKEHYKIFIRTSILLLGVLAEGCSKTVSTEPEPSTMNKAVTFTMVQEQVFNKSCAFSGCHAGLQPQAGMNLSDGNAYSNLVNVISKRNPNYKRVDPGNSSNSYIIKMLRNTGENTWQMPPSGKLSEDIIGLVESWINDGAKNN